MDLITFIDSHGSFFQTIILLIGAMIAIRQLNTLNRQLKGNSLQQIHSNDREIKTLRFTKPWLFDESKILSQYQEMQLNFYMNLLINHAKHIYIQHDLKAIPEEYWAAVDNDLKYSINHPVFKQVWELTRNYVPDGFRNYVDSLV